MREEHMQRTKVAPPRDATHNLRFAVERHAKWLHALLSIQGDDDLDPDVQYSLKDQVAELTARVYVEINAEIEKADQPYAPGDNTGVGWRFLSVVAQINAIAQVAGPDHTGSSYSDPKYMVPPPWAWFRALCDAREHLEPFMSVYSQGAAEEIAEGGDHA
jgi:hypothetical protein